MTGLGGRVITSPGNSKVQALMKAGPINSMMMDPGRSTMTDLDSSTLTGAGSSKITSPGTDKGRPRQ